jgi:hypothetical protein
MTSIPLETGLMWFYENQKELEFKHTSVERSHALAFEAGMAFGRNQVSEESNLITNGSNKK